MEGRVEGRKWVLSNRVKIFGKLRFVSVERREVEVMASVREDEWLQKTPETSKTHTNLTKRCAQKRISACMQLRSTYNRGLKMAFSRPGGVLGDEPPVVPTLHWSRKRLRGKGISGTRLHAPNPTT